MCCCASSDSSEFLLSTLNALGAGVLIVECSVVTVCGEVLDSEMACWRLLLITVTVMAAAMWMMQYDH